jgi:NTE family protein
VTAVRKKETGDAPKFPAGGRSFALVLGAGGARALAHVVAIEALDEMGVRPAAIAGTSFGALIGAAYAAGMSGKDIRRHVLKLAHDRSATFSRLIAARAAPISGWFAAPFGNPMLVNAGKLCDHFLPPSIPATFEELSIPLTAVATDLYGRSETVFAQGPLRTALAASIAIPGLVQPVEVGGCVLVDGGAVNPLPFDLLRNRADFVVAVDCSGAAVAPRGVPDPWESLFATLQVMGQAIVAEKLKSGGPDLVIRPNVSAFRLLDFFQASAILRAAEPMKAEIQERLGALLAA